MKKKAGWGGSDKGFQGKKWQTQYEKCGKGEQIMEGKGGEGWLKKKHQNSVLKPGDSQKKNPGGEKKKRTAKKRGFWGMAKRRKGERNAVTNIKKKGSGRIDWVLWQGKFHNSERNRTIGNGNK